MMIYWWQWVIISGTFMFMVIMYAIIYAGIVALKYIKANPKIEAIFYHDDGRVKERRQIKPANMFGSDWRLSSHNPRNVRFRIWPMGIGKAEERQWPAWDIQERNFTDGDKKLVEFNLKGRNAHYAMQYEKLYNKFENILVDNAFNRDKAMDTETRMEDKVKKRLDHYKSMMPFFGKSTQRK